MSTKGKKTCGVAALIIGVVLIVFSMVIKTKVREGEGQIYQAQQSLEKGQGLFNLSPYTKDIGDKITEGANRRISAGQDEIDYYTKISNIMLVAGIVCIAIGGYCLLIGGKSAR